MGWGLKYVLGWEGPKKVLGWEGPKKGAWGGGGRPTFGYFSIEKYYFKKAVDLQKFAAVFQHLK